MPGKDSTKRELSDVLKAISGSMGIKTVIAQRLGVTRQTVSAYLKKWKTAQDAYEDEYEGLLDMSESLISRNIQLGLEEQRETRKQVDSGDAKWVLSMKGAGRGYAPKQRLGLSNDEDGELVVRMVGNVKPDAL